MSKLQVSLCTCLNPPEDNLRTETRKAYDHSFNNVLATLIDTLKCNINLGCIVIFDLNS
jgi:hypothetical protein